MTTHAEHRKRTQLQQINKKKKKKRKNIRNEMDGKHSNSNSQRHANDSLAPKRKGIKNGYVNQNGIRSLCGVVLLPYAFITYASPVCLNFATVTGSLCITPSSSISTPHFALLFFSFPLVVSSIFAWFCCRLNATI